MANPNEGECPCPLCKKLSFIRRAVKGSRKYYIHCPNGCGNIQPNGPSGQEYILQFPLYGVKAPTNNPSASEAGATAGAVPPKEAAKQQSGAGAGGTPVPPQAKKRSAPVQPVEQPEAAKPDKPARKGGGGLFW